MMLNMQTIAAISLLTLHRTFLILKLKLSYYVDMIIYFGIVLMILYIQSIGLEIGSYIPPFGLGSYYPFVMVE